MNTPDNDALREDYPGLWHLLGGYFHQDWDLDDDSADAVLRRFARHEPTETVRRARRELADVLQRWPADAELDVFIDRFGSNYRPAGDGLTTRDWLVRVGEFLSHAG